MTGAWPAGWGPERLEELLTEVGRQVLAGRWAPQDARACASMTLELCPVDGVGAFVRAGAVRVGARVADPLRLGELASYLDHTLLHPRATAADVDLLCDEALTHRFASVCVNGSWVARCAEILAGSGVLVCSVVGFPLGAMASEVKAYEARRALEDGAHEIDMVLHVGALKGGDHDYVRRDIEGLVETVHRGGGRLKVILETALLVDEEKVAACGLARAAGADFVKTSTGFSGGGATVEDVALMRRVVGPVMGVKASGGVRDTASARAMIAAGATRIGASASVAIVGG